MSAASPDNSRNIPWVLLRISNQLFGVPATHVREMAEQGPATRIPQAPPHVLGLITLRGQIVPAIDLRRRLGLIAAAEERGAFLASLEEHEKAHTDLYKRLCADPSSVTTIGSASRCPTTAWLETGKEEWNGKIAQVVKIEPAHWNLHAVLEEAASASAEATARRITALKGKEMAELDRAFEGARERLAQAHPQIAVVLEWQGRLLAVTVDEVESIERLKDNSLEDLPISAEDLQSDLTRRTGKRVRDDAVVLILDLAALFESGVREKEAAGEMTLTEVVAG